MYEPGTILRLREPQSTEDNPYPYDLVKVVGQSPIQHSRPDSDSPFAGQDAVGYIITPHEGFGPTLDKPYGELAELYEIEEFPTDPMTGEPLRPENNPRNLPSPEQVFAKVARDEKPKQTERAPLLQDDRKSPEQVIRESEQAERKSRARRKKEDESDDS